MSENKVHKSVSLNKNNPDDVIVLKVIEQPGFNFNGFAREAMLEKITREQRQEQALRIVKKSEGGGIKIVVGR